MEGGMERSCSDPDVSQTTGYLDKTPMDYVNARYKRKRHDEYSADFNNFKEEIRAMMLSQEQKQQNQNKILKDIQQGNHNIQSSMGLLTSQNEEFKKKIRELETVIHEDKKYIVLLEDKIEDLQMGSRKANFELKNVPKKASETKEDLIEMVACLSKNVGGNLSKNDIKDIYRVRGKKEDVKNTPIVVETSSTLLKTDMLKMCKAFNVKHKTKLRALHVGMRTSEDTPIYVSEQLTAKGSRLHFLARDLAKSKKYKFCWTAYDELNTFNRINRNAFKPPVSEAVKQIVRANFTREIEFYEFCRQRLHLQLRALRDPAITLPTVRSARRRRAGTYGRI